MGDSPLVDLRNIVSLPDVETTHLTSEFIRAMEQIIRKEGSFRCHMCLLFPALVHIAVDAAVRDI